MKRFVRLGAALGILGLIAAGCGGGGGDDDNASQSTAEREEERPQRDDSEDLEVLSPEFASQLRGLAQGPSGANSSDDVEFADRYRDYELLTDVTETVQVSVPVEWSDTAGDVGFQAADGTSYGAGLAASPDLAGFNDTWGVPGVKVSASSTEPSTLGELLALNSYPEECVSEGVQDYSDAIYTGVSEVWTGCGGTDTEWVVIAALPEDQSYVVLVSFQLVSEADVEALDQVIASFEVVGTLAS